MCLHLFQKHGVFLVLRVPQSLIRVIFSLSCKPAYKVIHPKFYKHSKESRHWTDCAVLAVLKLSSILQLFKTNFFARE